MIIFLSAVTVGKSNVYLVDHIGKLCTDGAAGWVFLYRHQGVGHSRSAGVNPGVGNGVAHLVGVLGCGLPQEGVASLEETVLFPAKCVASVAP